MSSLPWAYLDTSALAKRYVREAGADRVRAFLAGCRVVTSAITPLELTSALRRRRAEGDLSSGAFAAILRRLVADRESWDLMMVGDDALSHAEDLAVRVELRALDAIHIASALVRSQAGLPHLPFVTADIRQARAARSLGLLVIEMR